MTWERDIKVDGTVYRVTISDNHEALCSADAEGRAVIGLWNREKENQNLSPASYLVESPDDVDDELLEKVVRRKKGIPWQIAVTRRLLIRELTAEDYQRIREEENSLFTSKEMLKDYICHQYGYYEYGIWALEDQMTGALIGEAGLYNLDRLEQPYLFKTLENKENPLELGYHIYPPYRKKGYGAEACTAILQYGKNVLSSEIYAIISADNQASLKLAGKLGFQLIDRTCNESALELFLYGWNC